MIYQNALPAPKTALQSLILHLFEINLYNASVRIYVKYKQCMQCLHIVIETKEEIAGTSEHWIFN